jgi:hypothetical protein
MCISHHLENKGGGGQLPYRSCQTAKSRSVVSNQLCRKQPAMHTNPSEIEVSQVKGQMPHFFLADMVTKFVCHFSQVVNFEIV